MGKGRGDEGGTWHTLEVAEVLRALDTEPKWGLSSEEAARRLEERGPNELEERGGRKPWSILWEQFTSTMIVRLWYSRVAPEIWQTMVFTTLTLSQLSHVMAIRSGDESLLKVGPLSNKPLLGAVALTFVLQLLAIYAPLFQRFLETEALPLADLAIAVVLSTIIFWAVEIEKWLARRKSASEGLNR